MHEMDGAGFFGRARRIGKAALDIRGRYVKKTKSPGRWAANGEQQIFTS
jgi:hypothetical protein